MNSKLTTSALDNNTVATKENNAALSPLPAKKMHHIVLTMVGLLFVIAATYPLSMYRVAQKSDGWGEKVKVKGIYVKTLDEANKPTINK